MSEQRPQEIAAAILAEQLLPPTHLRLVPLEALGAISVRLRHTCGDLSVYDVIRMGAAERFRIRNYGKKTEYELNSLLQARLPSLLTQCYASNTLDLIKPDQEETYPDLPHFLLLKESASIDKWINEISRDQLSRKIPEAARELPIKHVAISLGLDWPSSGGVSEIKVADALSLLPDRIFLPQKDGGLGRIKRKVAFLCLCAVAENAQELKSDPSVDPFGHQSLARINSRQRFILEKRLTIYPAATLEEIGREFKLTRERIRQEETKLLKLVSCSSLAPVLNRLSVDLARKLTNPTNSKRYILNREVHDFARTLDKAELFAIFTTGASGVTEWLEANSLKTRSGYFLGTQQEWAALSQRLQGLGTISGAIPVDNLLSAHSITKQDLLAYVALTKIGSITGDFLVAAREGKALSARAVHWYNIAQKFNQTSLSFSEFFSTNQLHPREARLVKASMTNSPTLFACSSSYFCCLGPKRTHQSFPISSEDDEAPTDSAFDDNSLIRKLYSYIELKWPVEGGTSGFEKIREHPELVHIPVGSIQAYLSTDYRIIRLSPGLFAPISFRNAERQQEKIDRAYRLALDESTIKAFLFARRSVKDCSSVFPIWNERFEAEVVRFLCRRSAEDALWESCAATCQHNALMDEASALRLLARKTTAQFRLTPSWLVERSYIIPSLHSTLAVAGRALDVGAISWIEANQLLAASQIPEERGVNCIILLSALGILSPISKWWAPIPITQQANKIFESLSNALHGAEGLSWNSPEIANLISYRSAAEIGVKEATLKGIFTSCNIHS